MKYCKALSSNNFSFSPISQLNVRLLIQLIHKLLPLKSDIVANEEDRNILLAQLCKDRLLRKQGDDFYHGVHRFPIYVTTHLTQKMWNE